MWQTQTVPFMVSVCVDYAYYYSFLNFAIAFCFLFYFFSSPVLICLQVSLPMVLAWLWYSSSSSRALELQTNLLVFTVDFQSSIQGQAERRWIYFLSHYFHMSWIFSCCSFYESKEYDVSSSLSIDIKIFIFCTQSLFSQDTMCPLSLKYGINICE